MKRLAKLNGTKKNRTQRLKERRNKAAMQQKMGEVNAGSNHRNPNHVCDINAPWRAARSAGLNPKKEPLARRARRDYGNPKGKFWKKRFRWDNAPIHRKHGKFETLLPKAASHLLQSKKPIDPLFGLRGHFGL
jgi:hypothetical protein